MPILSMFYGVVVYMYFYDIQRHHTPHFHVEFAQFSAVVCPSKAVMCLRVNYRAIK